MNGVLWGAPKRTNNQRERREQTHVVNWFRNKYPDTLLVASANGGRRDKNVGALMKKEGVLAGMPDLTVYTAKRGYHGLFIEFKPTPETHTKKKATLSILQKERCAKLNAEGYYALGCWGLNEAIKVMDWYMENIDVEEYARSHNRQASYR
jgi:hypothetical protein